MTRTHPITRCVFTSAVLGLMLLGCDGQTPESAVRAASPDIEPVTAQADKAATSEVADSDHNKDGQATSQPTTRPIGRPDPSRVTTTPRNLTPPPDPKVAHFCGLTTAKPATWIWHPPQRPERTVNWMVPGSGRGELAEIVVTHFPGEGGSIEANVTRWVTQFRFSEAMPAVPDTRQIDVDGMTLTIVEVAGEHLAVSSGRFIANRMMIAAIVDTPEGLVFVKLIGPTVTVAAHRTRFLQFLKEIRRETPIESK